MATVLLIDDHAETCAALRRLFKHVGHVACVEEAARALDAVRELRPALVMLDYMMPGADGLTVLAWLRADPDPRVARTPVVMYTAFDDPAFRDRALSAGADEFVAKGTPFAEILRRVARFLG